MDKLLEDMELKIKDLLATFRKIQLELEPLAMPTLERSETTRFVDTKITLIEPKKRGRKKKIQA